MKTPEQFRHEQKSVVFVALLLFNLVLVLIQLWLFVAVLENWMEGHRLMEIPATIATFAILGVNVWMLKGIYRMQDRP